MALRFGPGHLTAAASLAGGVWWLCAASAAADGRPGPPPRWREPVAARQEAAWPREFGRQRGGGTVRIARRPGRIVAGSVLSAEVLLAIAPRERLAAVHYLAADARYSMVAAEAGGLPLVGAGPEQLLALHPDLVLIDPFTAAETQRLLEACGIPVVRTPAIADFDGIADAIRMIGWVSGCDAAAERLCGAFRARLDGLRRDAARLGAWRIMNLDGALETYGRGSLLDAVFAVIGVHDVAAEHGVPAFGVVDVESVLAWRPDALLVGAAPGSEATAGSWLRQHPGLRHLPCVQKGRIVTVSHALLGSTSHRVVELAAAVKTQLIAWGSP